MRYFTSDLHLGSTLINKYAHRPYDSAKQALDLLVTNINDTCRDTDDVLIHVGDFMLKGADRHDKWAEEDIGLEGYTKETYLEMIKPSVFLIAGNHDSGHNVEAYANNMMIDLNQNWRNVSVSHFPSNSKFYHCPIGSAKQPHIHLCGHVHDKWLVYWDDYKNVMNINVGVDVWGYRPVRDAELTQLLDVLWNAKVQCPEVMTRKQFDKWHLENDIFVREQRQQRRADKHAKKGLTPEECQRRKEAAMRAKGLIK